MDADLSVFIGPYVEATPLFVPSTVKCLVCPNNHPRQTPGIFCSLCGVKLVEADIPGPGKTVPTEIRAKTAVHWSLEYKVDGHQVLWFNQGINLAYDLDVTGGATEISAETTQLGLTRFQEENKIQIDALRSIYEGRIEIKWGFFAYYT